MPHPCYRGGGDCDRNVAVCPGTTRSSLHSLLPSGFCRLVLSSLGGLRGIPLPSSNPAFPGTCPPLSGMCRIFRIVEAPFLEICRSIGGLPACLGLCLSGLVCGQLVRQRKKSICPRFRLHVELHCRWSKIFIPRGLIVGVPVRSIAGDQKCIML